ncbi:hypothetical protein SAMN04488564_103790 [Lentzea waywayandensis]|uniref:Uncharacterized protein n=1 Tax=Lentzea waywayandensis TaxID=84724 RepID=A0A1I6E3M4_9PSEU|nr:hypothetical protein [Lentzea waywayandensis]SFR12359.1 hypothetical protein SAMN04488564_103790 [Lentzea waywayandensis]
MTDIEQRLIKAARDGEWLRPGDVVRADLIRELLLGRHGDLDPRGVRLIGARVKGSLDLSRVNAVVGLTAQDCTFTELINARSARLPHLVLHGVKCTEIYADGLHVSSDLLLHAGTSVVARDGQDAIRLMGAHVAGSLELSGAAITSTTRLALNAAGITVGGAMIMKDDLRITGHSNLGAINMVGARFGSDLEVAATTITNTAGPAVMMNGAQAGGLLRLGDGTRFTGHGLDGTIRLAGTRIAGGVQLVNAEITNTAGPAIAAGGIRTDNLLVQGCRISAHSAQGTIDLMAGHIDTDLSVKHSEIANTAGPAVSAYRLHVDGAVILLGRTRLSANGGHAVLNLADTRVGGTLRCGQALEIHADANTIALLDLRNVVVGTSANLPPTLICRLEECSRARRVWLDEFSYASLGADWDWQKWLHLIRCHTPAYHASSYQRLAAVERAAGHDGTVRRILMAQQTDLRRRSPQSLGGPLTRWFHWLWGVLAGYGYRARRTAAALLLVLVVAGAIGWWAGQVDTRPGHLVAERVTSATGVAGVPCSTVELIGLGLDRGLPLAMTGMRARCDLDTASKKGQAFTAAIWLVQLAVWGLATLALAGYTNLVRKPG